MPDRPTLHLGNHSGRTYHGPGRRWTAMARPRHFERGEGTIWTLAPESADLRAVKAGTLPEADYFARYRARLERDPLALAQLRPGVLTATLPDGVGAAIVKDGDSALCCCSAAAALAGRCHLTHAAPYLLRAGWRVRLHGLPAVLGQDGTLGLLGGRSLAYGCRAWTYPLGPKAEPDRASLIVEDEAGWAWAAWDPSSVTEAFPKSEGYVLAADGLELAQGQTEAALERMQETPC